MDFNLDYLDLLEQLQNSDNAFGGKYFGEITDSSTGVLSAWDSAYAIHLASIDAMPESTDNEKELKWAAYVALYDGTYDISFTGNFTLFRIATSIDFVHSAVTYSPGQVIFWFAGAYYTIDELDQTTEFDWDKKFLSIFTSRFFTENQHEEYPNFVEFMREWMRYVETEENEDGVRGFYSILSKIEQYPNPDLAPSAIIPEHLRQLALPFHESMEMIPYFKDGSSLDYDKIRHFLRFARMWMRNRANRESIHTLFAMLGSKARVTATQDMLFRVSDYQNDFTYNETEVAESVTTAEDFTDWSANGVIATDAYTLHASTSGWIRTVCPFVIGKKYRFTNTLALSSGSGSFTVYDGCPAEDNVIAISGPYTDFVCRGNGLITIVMVPAVDSLGVSGTWSFSVLHEPYTQRTDSFSQRSRVGLRPGQSDLTRLFHIHGEDTDMAPLARDEDTVVWGLYSVLVETDHDLVLAKKIVKNVWKAGGVMVSFRQNFFDPVLGWGAQQFGDEPWGTDII